MKKLDTFYFLFGHSISRFIVKEVLEDGYICTSIRWLKREGIFISKIDIENKQFHFLKLKPYSKLRWFLKL